MTVEKFPKKMLTCSSSHSKLRHLRWAELSLSKSAENKENYSNRCKLRRLAEICCKMILFPLTPESFNRSFTQLSGNHWSFNTNLIPQVQSLLNLFRFRRLGALKIKSFCKSLETLEIAGCTTQQSQPWDWVEKREFQGSKTPPPTDRFIHNTSIIVNRVTKQIRAILYAAVVAMCLVCSNTPPHSVPKVPWIVDQRFGLQMSSAS